MALCSLVNNAWRQERPNHQFSLKPVRSMPVSFGSSSSRPLGSSFSLPSSNVRTAFCFSSVEPYSWEPSHQWVSVLPKSIDCPLPLLPPLPDGAPPELCAGTDTVRRTCIGCSGQSSLSSIGTSIVSSGLPRPWKNQLWFSNWIQAAASTLRVVAGLNSSRVISSRETLRALGS